MEDEITTEELGQIIRAARVLSTDFNEEQIKSLSYAWQKLADTGFLDAVWGMVRLQQEQGTSCSEALGANRELLKQKRRLERELAIIREQVKQEQNKHSETIKTNHQLAGKINTAKNELQAIQTATQKGQERLSSFQEKADKKKRRIEKELERCKKNAGVTAEEIAAAGQLKAEVEKSGFDMETMLGLVQEFAPYQDAKGRLTEALKTSQSLTEYLTTLKQNSEEKERSIRADIDQLLNLRSTEESELKRLEVTRRQLEINVSRLHADLDEEQSLRQFYMSYRPLSGLLDYLVSWNQVYFMHCDNPMCTPFAGITRFWTDRPVSKCPRCGSSMIAPDPEPFRLVDTHGQSPWHFTVQASLDLNPVVLAISHTQ